ncbi:MAG TPA: alginate export family protein [Candidatus Binatia bacterium]|jgi:hypothetical protein|nr:alginate export family protein [Candidatus Binatia bacterium]
MPRPRHGWIGLLLLACTGTAGAETSWLDHFTFTFSERLRGEFVDFFEPSATVAPAGANRYDFLGSQTRLGVRATFPHLQLVLEMQDTQIANLPEDASLPPPQGNLGTGAIYYANTRRTPQSEPFLKLGFLTYRSSGLALTGGRFEVRDGLETTPGDATLAFVKKTRIAERLVGPFDFTHVTRSFDGMRATWDRPGLNLTAFATKPTAGGFEISANREIEKMGIAGVSITSNRLPIPDAPPADLRFFWLYYDDSRDDVLKVDNRPLAVRMADHDAISINTVGGHAITAVPLGPGTVDLLGWGVVQAGRWGTQDHAAWAFAFEAGYQLPRLPAAPWLRVGIDRSSGDDDPFDDVHESFFQVLPTARTYAQFPFYNLMNDQDVFAELILRPHSRVTIRADYHWLEVTEGRDLWYAGGGATNDDIFGFSGSPAAGHRELAQVADVSVTVQVIDRLTCGAYYGHAFGGDVVRATYPGVTGDYGLVELTFRY